MRSGIRIAATAALLVLAAGCAGDTTQAGPAVALSEPVQPQKQWQQVASAEDEARLAKLEMAWREGLDEARARRFRGAVADEGELLDPAIALPRAAPPPGPYRCRVVKLGRGKGRGIAFRAFPPFFCYVEAEKDLLTIVKQTGSQRPAGRLYEDADERLIFLGTLALGEEEAPLPYGEDPKRDLAGVVERVAPFRWRLVLPFPSSGDAKLEVLELVPVAE